VLVVTAGIAAMVAFLVSALPALRAGRASLARMLAGDTRSATSGRGRHAVRRGLVVAQVALALVLLTAAGLLARSFQRLQAVDPGFRAEHAATFRVVLPPAAYRTAADVGQVVDRVLDALRALPGVQAAGAVTRLPLDEEARQDSAVFLEDRPLRPGMMPGIHEIVFVTPGYFRAMGIPVIAGRVFDRPATGADPAQLPRELVVSKAFAERYWKGQDAIGKRIRMNPADPWSTVVGVVGDVHAQGLDQPPTDAVYSPLVTVAPTGSSYAPRQLAFVVRASGAASTLATGARRAVEQVDSSLPLYRVQPLAELLARSLARTTFTLVLLGVAAVMALWVGAMGIYGVLAYLVSLRTREIGVRMALGAQAAEVRALVARQGARDALLGIVAGLAIAVASMRLLSRLLYGVSPVDPVALAGASVALLFTALLASWIPARRAAALDPVEALRAD
jgi:predicted permease